MTRRSLLRLLALFVILAVIFAALARWVPVRTDLSFIFPDDASSDTELLMGQLQQGPAAGVILIALAEAPTGDLVALSNDLAKRLIESGRFDFVTNGTVTTGRESLGALFDKRYLLNPPVTPEMFTVTGLRDALETGLADLTTSIGAARKELFAADPTSRLDQVMAAWSDAGPRAGLGGLWMSEAGDKAWLTVRLAAGEVDLTRQSHAVETIETAFAEAVEGLGNSARDVTLTITGPSVFAVRTSELIRAEMQLLTVASSIAVAVLLLLAFRSIALLLIVALPLGLGVAVGMVAVRLGFGEIHGITLAFGGVLIGIAIVYPLHLMSHSRAPTGLPTAIQGVWQTLFLGMATTVVAFLPMTLSSFRGLAQLGVFAISGLVVAFIATRWLLPRLIPEAVAPPIGAWSRIGLPDRWRRQGRLAVIAIAVLAVPYLWTQGPALWEGDLRNLSPTPPAARAVDRDLRREMGAADVRYLVVIRQPTMESVLQQSEAFLPRLDSLVEAGDAAGFQTAAAFLPSDAAQAARQEILPDAPALRRNLAAASEGLPFDPAIFEPFVASVIASKDGLAVTPGDFEGTGLDGQLKALLFQQGEDWIGLIVPLGLKAPEKLAALVRAENNPALAFWDLKAASETVVAGYRREAALWLGLGGLLGLVVLLVALRSGRRVAAVILPIGLSLLLTAAILSLMGTAFSLFHLLSMLLVMGVGLDYSLFFNRQEESPDDVLRTLRANVFCAMTSVTVFAILAFSQIPVLHSIGATVSLGAALSLVFAYLFAAPPARSVS